MQIRFVVDSRQKDRAGQSILAIGVFAALSSVAHLCCWASSPEKAITKITPLPCRSGQTSSLRHSAPSRRANLSLAPIAEARTLFMHAICSMTVRMFEKN
jgi:hypothetical protein